MRTGAVTVFSIAAMIVTQLRFLPNEAGDGEGFWPRSGQNAWASYADGGVVNLPQVPSGRVAVTSPMRFAQGGRGARDDGAAARSDALMGTPNKKTPVPQDNLFSTSPRLEQQPPAAAPPAPRGTTPAPPAAPR
jgi:hypothetical protein